MLNAVVGFIPKQELVSLVTRNVFAVPATPESGLALEVSMMIQIRAETKRTGQAIMERNTLRQWAMYWYNDSLKIIIT